LPALDLPSACVRAGNRRPVRDRLSRKSAHPLSHARVAGKQRRAGLQRPGLISARVQELAAGWRRSARSDAEVVRAALAHFRTEKFFYTLEPPALEDDPVDEFLFETRRGFCEHFAAAFVTLMRSAGIPARVVTGYQGGEFNPSGNYLIVRQLDAHAWAELWLPGQGWARVDPTAAVAPERIEYGTEGIRRLLARGAVLGGLPSEALRELLALGALEQVHQRLRLSWDAANTAWQRWVLGYDRARQRELLAQLGFEDVNPLRLLGLLALLVALVMGLYVMLTRRRVPRPDPVLRVYFAFCRKLAQLGLVRAPQEGALRFAERGAHLHPQLADAIHAITHFYLHLRYGGNEDAESRREFARRVAAFRPRRG
jgi:transglutaminase-like putative cysteine protease